MLENAGTKILITFLLCDTMHNAACALHGVHLHCVPK